MAAGNLTAARLREVLHYDPETGVFTWLKAYQRRLVGQQAGRLNDDGYIRITVDGIEHSAHRLAWLYVHGEWPSVLIDHHNGRRSENRLSNLREADRYINAQNERSHRKTNVSGFLGVRFSKGRWRSDITIDGKPTFIGRFDTPEAAHEAYVAAKRMHHLGCTI
jgi:hypothetical protein